jgi:two-component system OmpR family response regulator
MSGTQAGNNPSPRWHVLVVDDDVAIRSLVSRVLSQSYRVTSASDPREALAIAGHETSIDLLLLDVMMPTMNGFDLAKRLRLLPSCSNARVVFLTARDFASDKIKGIQAGARSYITKPFSIDDLLSRVKKALS